MISVHSSRNVDKKIYADIPIDRPKEIHKQVVSLIGAHFSDKREFSCLDAGCAQGSFLYLLKNSLSDKQIHLTGLDIHKELLNILKENIKEAITIEASLTDTNCIKSTYDAITCLGTFSIFDDFQQPFENLYSSLNERGILIISGEFNNFPIDVIMRYRDVRNSPVAWEKGWNVFSKMGIESFLSTQEADFEWIDFKMPFARAPHQEDPMRTWTIQTNENQFQQINGAGQLVNQSILKITKKRPKA
jgi:SAM-dependent methyltransferase